MNGTVSFRENSISALRDPALRAALKHATGTFSVKRAEAIAGLPFEEWRERASNTRLKVIDNLAGYVETFSKNATKAGAVVIRAKTASEADTIIADLLKDHNIKRVVKAKSMVSEEIHLNDSLEKSGIQAVETDLGEYIIQIAREHPSHIIVPAIHKNRSQVGRLFADKLGCEYSDDPANLTRIAQKVLREEFMAAQAGLSGANFLIADTGSLVLFSNEGNIRMCTTLPPLHIAVVSIEKIIPSLSDLPTFMRLLPRSATGQALTSYMSVITGARKPGETTGAERMFIVLLDNGRSEIASGPYREMLKCIKCGACLNACPVYMTVGGHAYGSTYPGPMGIIYTTLLNGIEASHPLLDATTLCGACADVCPPKVPLTDLLRKLREERVERNLTPASERVGMTGFGLAAKRPSLFSVGQTAAKWGWPIAKTVNPAVRRMPNPAGVTFDRRMQ